MLLIWNLLWILNRWKLLCYFIHFTTLWASLQAKTFNSLTCHLTNISKCMCLPFYPDPTPTASSPWVSDPEQLYFVSWHSVDIQPLHDRQCMVLIRLTNTCNSHTSHQMWHKHKGKNEKHLRVKKYVHWPSGLSFVEQLSAHWFRTECRRWRSSHLFLTWPLSSEPQPPKLQRSARPPVKSTKALDTCPAQSLSYEPWSLHRAHGVGIPIYVVYDMGQGIFHNGMHAKFDLSILKRSLKPWE